MTHWAIKRHDEAPNGRHRRLLRPELHARGLSAFSRGKPSIAEELRLPTFAPGQRLSWPPPPPPSRRSLRCRWCHRTTDAIWRIGRPRWKRRMRGGLPPRLGGTKRKQSAERRAVANMRQISSSRDQINPDFLDTCLASARTTVHCVTKFVIC